MIKHGLIFKLNKMKKHDDEPTYISFDINIEKCEECGRKFKTRNELHFLTNVEDEDGSILYLPLCLNCTELELGIINEAEYRDEESENEDD